MYSDSNNPLDLSSEPPQNGYAKQNGGLVANHSDNDDRGRTDKSDYGDERHLSGMHLGATNSCAGKFLYPFLSGLKILFINIIIGQS